MIYVISDVHGNTAAFRSVLDQIHLSERDELYVLGDLMDRNPGGMGLLLELMEKPNVHLLLGNHELMMLQYLADPNPRTEYQWFRNGGAVTLQEWEALTAETQLRVLKYLRALPLRFELSAGGRNWLLVHAAPEEWRAVYDRKGYDRVTFCVWYRLQGEEPVPGGATLVFGHTPTPYYQEASPNTVCTVGEGKIDIDCGAAYEDGRLACLRLDDGQVFYSR